MATAQKRGFHFPWGGESHQDEGAPAAGDREPVDRDELAQRIGSSDDEIDGELGGTPVRGSAVDAPVRRGTPSLELARAVWPESDRQTVGPLAATNGPRPERDAEAEPLEAEVTDAVEPEATPEDGPEPASRGEEEVVPERSIEREPTPEPPAAAAPRAEVPTASPRRDNPLVAGLVRAMRDAARTARDETIAALHADAAARADAIRAESTIAVTELKKVAEADVVSIKEWSRAELARVREETETRITARRTQLVAETEAAGLAAEDLLGRLDAAIEAFEIAMAAFFDGLLAEDDPARLAALAERMPAAPDLDAFPTPARHAATGEPAVEVAVSGAEPGSEPEALETEPRSGETSVAEAEPSVEDAPVDEAGRDAPTEADGQAEPDASSVEAEDPRIGWLEHLDAQAAAAAEAEALAGLDRQTNVIVSGLSSVAAIATFKAALVHVEGVSAVSVTAATNGDVQFTVTHEGQTELRDAIRRIEAFETRLIADDGDTISVAVREPAA